MYLFSAVFAIVAFINFFINSEFFLRIVIFGIGDKDTIDKAGKAIIIYETIEKNKKKLRFLGNSLDNVDTIITQITEFKKHNISVEMLAEQVEKTQDQYLKAKLNDMLIMYKALDEKISENFIDENNLLNYLYE